MTSVDPILHTPFTDKLRRREAPSAQELREHLLEVHRRNAGFTETCAWASRDVRGRNSYQWLAELIEPQRHTHVLDLACGSGRLSALCHEQHGDAVCLVGVDMSEDELALARARLRHAQVTLHQGLAQDLHVLQDESVDVALCHWALTLMDPVGPVLAEVARVLRPGGVFGAIVDGDMRRSPSYEAIHQLIYDAVCDEYPGYGEFDLGDARVRSTAALSALASEYFDGCPVQVEPGLVHLDAPPGELARIVAGFFYASFVLCGASRARMLSALETYLAGQGDALGARFSMPINRLVVTKETLAEHRRAHG
ncbi:MAG: class I SAM-dependent methyltransferase [Pseudomonadota bacterium]